MYSKYMTGADFSKMPYTDSMQRNPLYSGSPRAAGQQQSPTQGATNAPKIPAKPAIDMTAYRPSAAQAVPPKPQGTPYQPYVNNQGQQFAGTMSFAPGTSDAYRNQAFGNWANSQGYYKQPSQVTGDPRGALAAASPADRPPPFQMGLASTPWGMSADPFVERDALIQRLAAQRMQDQIAFNSGGPVNPVAGMLPWRNVPQAMQEAGLAGGAPSMQPGYGGGFVGAANGGFGQNMGYTLPGRPSVPPSVPPPGTPPASPLPGYGTPPSQRGTARMMDWRDGDGDGVDDRDQDGPGMPRYGAPAPGASSGNAATDRLRAKHPNWDNYPEWYRQQQYKQDAWEQSGNAGGSSRAPGSKQPASQVAPEAWITDGPAMGRAQPIPPPSQGTPYAPPDPSAVNDVKALPFYRDLLPGDTVRRDDRTGGYHVFDKSGKSVRSYSASGSLNGVASGANRSGPTMYEVDPANAAAMAEERRASADKLKAAAAEKQQGYAANVARLQQLHSQLRKPKPKQGLAPLKDQYLTSAGQKSPEFNEYHQLRAWLSQRLYDNDATQEMRLLGADLNVGPEADRLSQRNTYAANNWTMGPVVRR